MIEKRIIRLIFGLLAGVLVLLSALYIWSAQIPDRWQKITSGMKQDDVATFLGTRPTTTEDDRDVWMIERPIGRWELLVSYHEDGDFLSAHINFRNPLGSGNDRTRNYTWTSPPYHVRAQN